MRKLNLLLSFATHNLSQDLDSEMSERVQAFGYDLSESQDAEMGLGESLLHLEGKRDKDKQLDSDERRELKRKNREAAQTDEAKRKKSEASKKRVEKLKLFSSAEKVGKLCSGQETCCSKKCLGVRLFPLNHAFTFLAQPFSGYPLRIFFLKQHVEYVTWILYFIL